MDALSLHGAQQAAAACLETHLAVTAGAGSGKTRTLVARYLNFVARGAPLRSLVAITFTEKAAREMRARLRRELDARLRRPEQGLQGGELLAELDSARIGTIHALCVELLRLHPAEAAVDPLFVVAEEGLAAAWRAQAVDAALAWAANDPDAARLFAVFRERELRELARTLLERRLDAAPRLSDPDALTKWEAALERWLGQALAEPAWAEALETLGACAGRKADDRLEAARRSVLAQWAAVEAARAARDWDAAFAALRELRKTLPASNVGQKTSWDAATLEAARNAMRALREHYAGVLGPVVKDAAWELDRQVAGWLPEVRRLFARALAEYDAAKAERAVLDFDDLESRAVALLTARPQLAADLGVRAVLVDEFQDTNERQRRIVYALARFDSPPVVEEGPGLRAPANLFVVGDEKQSIYRFRGADVTVFRELRADLVRGGGRALSLDLTFRAHAPLLAALERLLRPLMGDTDDAGRPYRVPFAPLAAQRAAPRQGRPPFVELHLGLGDAAAGRRAAAESLARRLGELRAREGFDWGDMALLFRASTTFPVYEAALAAAGIPFVTVAGRGFYDRPEIRDLLNALAALADPSDDLALAGLLRSPAFGLTDADLFRLRFPDGGEPQPLYPSLCADPAFLAAAALVSELHTLSGRLPVAELLKVFLDRTHYRALLHAELRAGRLSRNVDKLLADAHRSRLVSVGDFLEYVAALRDVGAREGEAPADPGGGAVQLMTVHKAKGLEFPLVVLADAGHDLRGGARLVQLDSDFGVLLNLQHDGACPITWRLGEQAETDRAEAEDARLLYVALTRAQEKVLISGQARLSASKTDPGRLLLAGWLAKLGNVIGLDGLRSATAEPDAALPLTLAPEWAETLSVTLHPLVEPPPPQRAPAPEAAPAPVLATRGPLVAPLSSPLPVPAEPELPDRVWRVSETGRHPPAWVVGRVAHAALRRWVFPDDPEFETRLRPAALEAGLVDETLIRAALRAARRLLERFHAHPLAREIDQGLERHTEIPYTGAGGHGFIDLLWRGPAGWQIVDFKTDELRDEAALGAVLDGYRRQVRRYVAAVAAFLGRRPQARLVFLNFAGEVRVVSCDED